jgi:hypothetical protein
MNLRFCILTAYADSCFVVMNASPAMGTRIRALSSEVWQSVRENDRPRRHIVAEPLGVRVPDATRDSDDGRYRSTPIARSQVRRRSGIRPNTARDRFRKYALPVGVGVAHRSKVFLNGQ